MALELIASVNLRTIQILEGVFAVLAVLGLIVHSDPRWDTWLFFSLFVGMDTWRCLRVGKISTGSDYRWYGFTFDRDESPLLFNGAVAVQILVALALFVIFLCSL